MDNTKFICSNNPDDLFLNSLVGAEFQSREFIEKKFSFSAPALEANVRNTWFDGIRIGYSEWEFKKDQDFSWTGDLELVTLYFNLRGKVSTDTSVYGYDFTFGNYQHNVSYAPRSGGLIKSHDGKLVNFMVQFQTTKFLELINDFGPALQQFGESVSKGIPCRLSPENMYINAALLGVINSILHCPFEGGMRKIMLYARCLELLVLQTDASQKLQHAGSTILKTDHDKECVLYAREYLLEHMDNPPTLPELARLSGINEFKLKNGFKQLFGNTVFGYLADQRLELAANQMADNSQSISSIALKAGYSSVQHFNKAFRKKFGAPPGKLRKY
ncbi:helix-turn-helix domain-containing protein [Chitinophaga qingshengii]|uniref:Helix-turn-helix transcriptional regulator n=1 Tax=Chitinophaga qingshengii TaxID=1569794 RepID=A0ABR7TWW5_9BACT|nr:AraC family transcriptional regulator [Chitinophaga qingshengii]MBC9934943.1 helix-turn-helix transcriptional regulator [Chitinophaga qingshengii]